jgi:hypothetical protein
MLKIDWLSPQVGGLRLTSTDDHRAGDDSRVVAEAETEHHATRLRELAASAQDTFARLLDPGRGHGAPPRGIAAARAADR